MIAIREGCLGKGLDAAGLFKAVPSILPNID